jgi:DNA-binding transcriptional ArsR family regulator
VSAYHENQLDALGDPTRRAILASLLAEAQPVGKLAQHFPMSRPAISQHLKILKDAGLVADRPAGTRRIYAINPDGFRTLRNYLDQFWTEALDAFQAKAEQTRGDNEMVDEQIEAPVRKTIAVRASREHAFRVFTAGFDSWWPKSHHIGKSPARKFVLEGHVGGRCYAEQEDGTACDWGSVVAWEPPHRLVLAWKINGDWQYEPELSKASEVEVRFTEESPGVTRVDLEHRNWERMGPAGAKMRAMVAAPGGWGSLLEKYAGVAAVAD